MIDWLLDILYNIGMAIGAVIAVICVGLYFSAEAEYKNPNVSNYRMLQEMRKLNRRQREQIEQEKTAYIQTEMRPLKPLGVEPIRRMNASIERWADRIEAYVERKKQEKMEKRGGKPLTGIAKLLDRADAKLEQGCRYLDVKIAEAKQQEQQAIDNLREINVSRGFPSDDLDKKYDLDEHEGYELFEKYAIRQLQEGIEAARLSVEARRRELTAAQANVTAEFWEQCAAAKAECIALGDTKGLAQIEAQLADLETLIQECKQAVEAEEATLRELDQQLYALMFPAELPSFPSTPPPLPPFS